MTAILKKLYGLVNFTREFKKLWKNRKMLRKKRNDPFIGKKYREQIGTELARLIKVEEKTDLFSSVIGWGIVLVILIVCWIGVAIKREHGLSPLLIKAGLLVSVVSILSAIGELLPLFWEADKNVSKSLAEVWSQRHAAASRRLRHQPRP